MARTLESEVSTYCATRDSGVSIVNPAHSDGYWCIVLVEKVSGSLSNV